MLHSSPGLESGYELMSLSRSKAVGEGVNWVTVEGLENAKTLLHEHSHHLRKVLNGVFRTFRKPCCCVAILIGCAGPELSDNW